MSTQSAYRLSSEAGEESDANLTFRLDLFEFLLGNHTDRPAPELTDHAQCLALSSCLRGKLCERLAQLPARHVEAGDHLYLMGNPARSVFLLQSGLVKT